jgi:ADP-ribosyl-[dinitrogen reductase] hydrolase
VPFRRSNPELVDRARGALLGLAAGDALGAALEWLSPEQIAIRYGGPLRDLVASGMWEMGEWTDDTAMMLALAQSLSERGGYDEDDLFARYAVWIRSGPKDVGATVCGALERARSADEARRLAEAYHERSGGKSAGNGSLMRTAPIGLRYRRDRSELERISRADSSMTHHDPLAADACVFFNQTLAALVEGRKLPKPESAVAETALAATGASEDELLEPVQRQMGFVLTALRVGYAAAFGRANFEEAVVFAANLGGDADTNAAVAGALAGARFGADAIPQRWLEPLREREVISGDATRLVHS